MGNNTEETNHMFEHIKDHVGHNIECIYYGRDNVTLECIECNIVLYSVDKYDI